MCSAGGDEGGGVGGVGRGALGLRPACSLTLTPTSLPSPFVQLAAASVEAALLLRALRSCIHADPDNVELKVPGETGP